MGDRAAKNALLNQFARVVRLSAVVSGWGCWTCWPRVSGRWTGWHYHGVSLQTLKAANLVTTREGTEVIYRLAGTDVAAAGVGTDCGQCAPSRCRSRRPRPPRPGHRRGHA